MTMVLICVLSVAASAQVVVTKIAKDDPATGLKIVTVLMTVRGDNSYSDDPATPAELGILCQQSSLGKQKKLDVSLTLGAGVAAQTGIPVSIGLQSLGIILTPIRFDQDEQPRQLEWHQTEEFPGILIRNDFKFVRDHIFKSKLVHIEIARSGNGGKGEFF